MLLQKLLDPSTLEFTSLGKLEKTVHRLRTEHEDVMQFKSRLEMCHNARNKISKEEMQAYTHWLTRVEGAYSSILVSQYILYHYCKLLVICASCAHYVLC